MSKSPVLRRPARAASASLLRLQSDERLAELAAAGHDAAFDAIVLRFRPALLRYCGAIVGASRAEDAVQQTLINAHAALADADEVRHLRSWLYRIAHNVSLNVLRGVRDDVSLDAEGVGAALPAGAASPAASYESSERFREMVAALQALPENQRAALVLRELEGRSHEEIAEALGVTAGSARQHLMRARVAMRGAVTAVTPWGLIVRLAELASAGGTSGGGLDAAAGAGAAGLGAGLAKLTAGVMATGALVGGAAVGTHEVVRHDSAAPARADTIRPAKHVVTTRAAPPARTTTISTTTLRTTTTPRQSEHSGMGKTETETEHHHRGSSGSGSGRDHPDDSSAHSSSGHGSSSSSSSGPGSDDSSSSGSGSGRDRTESSGSSRGSGSSDDSISTAPSTPALPTPSVTDSSGSGDSGSSGSGSSGSSGSSGGSGSSDLTASGDSGSGGSHGGGSDDD